MDVLWLLPKWTFPINDGARVATDSLLRNTVGAGARVDVLCCTLSGETPDPTQMKQHWAVDSVDIVKLKRPTSRLGKLIFFLHEFIKNPRMPLTFSAYGHDHIRSALKQALARKKYDFIVMDGLHLGTMFLAGKELQRPGPKLIYRAHNVEVDLWIKATQSKKNAMMKLLLLQQAKAVGVIEQNLISQMDGVAAIAPEDLVEIHKISPEGRKKLIPLGLNFAEPLPLPQVKKSPKFLFVGRLDWQPNREGLEWLLKEVWPQVIKKRPDVTLTVVGSGDGSWIKAYLPMKGLNFLGKVPDIRKIYEECDVSLVPLHFGSGTRIKVIESICMNRYLVSTKMGVQGAGLTEKDYLEANTADEWIGLLSDFEITAEGNQNLVSTRAKLSQQYCEKNVGKDFYEWLRTFA